MTDEVRVATAIADGEEIRVLVQDRYGVTWVAPMGSPPEGDAWRRLAGSGMHLRPSPLVEFLTARLDGDEAVARAALTDPVASWSGQDWIEIDGTSLTHAQRHDPERVLREVEAKRAIVALHIPRATELPSRRLAHNPASWLHPLVLRHLASVYADHPDYREEWRP